MRPLPALAYASALGLCLASPFGASGKTTGFSWFDFEHLFYDDNGNGKTAEQTYALPPLHDITKRDLQSYYMVWTLMADCPKVGEFYAADASVRCTIAAPTIAWPNHVECSNTHLITKVVTEDQLVNRDADKNYARIVVVIEGSPAVEPETSWTPLAYACCRATLVWPFRIHLENRQIESLSPHVYSFCQPNIHAGADLPPVCPYGIYSVHNPFPLIQECGGIHKSGQSSKRTIKFKRNHLNDTIKDRHKHRAAKQKIQGKQAKKPSVISRKSRKLEKSEAQDDLTMRIDDDGSDDQLGFGDDDDAVEPEAADDLSDQMQDSDAGSVNDDDLSDLQDDAKSHKLNLEALKTKDPEFYKYLLENDRELLAFDEDDEAERASQASMEQPKTKKGKDKAVMPDAIVVTKELIQSWSRQILQSHSLHSLREPLLAFRSAAASGANADGNTAAKYIIQTPSSFNRLVNLVLRYVPLVLAQRVPYRELPNGRFKTPNTSRQYASAQRIVKSYFASLVQLLEQVTDPDLLRLSLTESAKLLPYVIGNRKVLKDYLKALVSLWSGPSADRVKLAAIIVLRKLALAGDAAVLDDILKRTYVSLLSVARRTTAFTLPTINLLKNSASELYLLKPEVTYQLAFGYIRQLAIQLRNSMKLKQKDASAAVYNWQWVHAIDFWSIVLASASDSSTEPARGASSLHQLVFPLVQISLGAMKLTPNTRYRPFHLHLCRSLLRIMQRSGTYIPLAAILVESLDSPDFTRKAKASSLKPLDWQYYIRTPTQYEKTRVQADGLAEEIVFLLLEFFATQSLSIALPELSIPVIMVMRRHAKNTSNTKLNAGLRALIEKVESNCAWIKSKRASIEFAPNNREEVASFLRGEDASKTALGQHLRLQTKLRDQRQALLERAAQDEEADEA
ncbi:uncharacterized protein L969DRAFT_92183 [Mixia osmundae IAM 14324]|uniref:Nucleolar complex protein 2 n=1 Tax=Mixia osmundae (strain CBS 9802 / IAM 14324 / JCM 22182 / KY 12970) TaxID=764103 RepID=G7DT30_MIXOS|nr:uncharacterized protein L969DRAFT_92183 [Mixia osmundae IAM 14324]KEI42757.1 hypothetical protein L969DRAFT_92183 [Mixia osmundae IAM 14324]GAA93909.1 hypothetical protein E5Q_00555 [Mixia osmundae IAM 14324]